MPQNRELLVTLKYTSTVADMKHAICTATGVPITDFYLMNGVRVRLDDDTLLKSRLNASNTPLMTEEIWVGVIKPTAEDLCRM